ncbi:hypothetical protein [Melittangium boletus]|uniref:hypothetical protein n=1 Tax=Melittangium boletus TaxID=83453 RepID=UPI003DA5887C
MIRPILLSLLTTLSSPACGGDSPPTPNPPDAGSPDAGSPDAGPPDAGPLDLQQRIANATARVQADTCFQSGQDVSGCDWGDYPFDPAAFSMEPSTQETLLIVDGFAELPPRAIRYKNRLKGFFRVDGSGEIAPVSFAWHAPRVLFETLSEFAESDLLPAEALRALSGPLSDTYGTYANKNAGHGSYVFSLLVEANPRQPIVILDHLGYDKFARTDFCDGSGSEASLGRLREKAEGVAANLRRLMDAHQVRFVNVSAGESLDTMRDSWKSACGGALPGDDILRAKLNAYAPIVEALYNTPGVFAAQAAIQGSNSQDFPFDFPSPSYPNRLLAGYFTTLESGLDAQGRRSGTGTFSGWPGRQNVDLYLNSGVLPNRPFRYNMTPLLQVDGFGVDIFPITQTTTSWITPLALSRFIHARYALFPDQAMSNALISRIRETLTPAVCPEQAAGTCAYQDPLKHGQLEAVRLGYWSPEYVESAFPQSTLSRWMEFSQ